MRDPDKCHGAHNVLVIRPGDECFIGDAISATVNQVCVRNGNGGEMGIQYQVAWWSGNDRKCEWLEEHEVKSISPNGPFMQIGFQAAK